MKFATRAAIAISLLLLSTTLAADKPVYVEAWGDKPDDWYRSDEGRRVIDNIISWQNPNGGWWKQYNTLEPRPADAKPKDGALAPKSDTDIAWSQNSTFDNGATFNELRMLARAHRVTDRADAAEAFARGIRFLLESQYPNGGWPQRYPPPENYGKHITYNDGAMAGVMKVLRDAASGKGDYAFVDPDTRARCQQAFDRGVDCILKTQVVVHGTPTVWCQQHDEITLAPTSARTFEPAALCSTESVDLVLLLMDLPNPDENVRRAIESAVAWFEKSQIHGKRYDRIPDPSVERGIRRELVDDPTAPPLWARLYDIATNRPIVVDRDGSIHDTPDQLSVERRNGYAWYSTAPAKVFKAYEKWKSRQ